VLNLISPAPAVTLTSPLKIVVLSLLVAIKFATVSVATIVASAIAENVTEPEDAEPAGGALKLFVDRTVLPDVLKIKRAVVFVVPEPKREITASAMVLRKVTSAMVIVIIKRIFLLL
jgi:hypothetical protein